MEKGGFGRLDSRWAAVRFAVCLFTQGRGRGLYPERAAQDALNAGSGEVKRPAGVWEIHVGPNPSGEGDYVEFQMGGAGLGPSTSYWGVMFSQGGPLGFQGVALNYAPDGGGWLWEEPGGDNWSRVTPLAENWYLYEMHF